MWAYNFLAFMIYYWWAGLILIALCSTVLFLMYQHWKTAKSFGFFKLLASVFFGFLGVLGFVAFMASLRQ